jgi:EthD domain-containing protein
MIRLVYLMRRKAGMSLSDFSAYWRDEHGPLVASHQARLGILRYVQAHRDLAAEEADELARATRGRMEPPYDGAAEVWWASEEALVAAGSTEAGRRAGAELLADEARFVELTSSPLWLAHEYPQVSVQHARPVARPKTGVVKVCFPIRPLPGLSLSAAQLYWRTVHGPLVRSHAMARGRLCYQQVHRYESPLSVEMRKERGTVVEPYMGHAEAWFDRLAPRVGPEVEDAAAAAVADERNFIDLSRSTQWTAKELVFIDRDWL